MSEASEEEKEETQQETFSSEQSIMQSIISVNPGVQEQDLKGRIYIAKYCFLRIE